MNIIVSNNKVDYTGFVKVPTLKNAVDVVGSVDILVYHKSNESRDEKVEYLTKLKDSVNTLLYVRNEKDSDQAVKMIVLGSNGTYINDEFYLENGDELQGLIADLNEERTELVELGGVSVLNDFLNRYLQKGSSDFNINYLTVVKSAVKNMLDEYNKINNELVQLSETATDIFTNSSELISHIKADQERLLESINKFEELKNSGKLVVSNQNTGSNMSVVYYPTVNYIKESNIIRIKALGNPSYMVSFVLGMQKHLELIKNVRPKVIFIYPVGYCYEKRYSAYKWLTSKTKTDYSNVYSNVIFTNIPSKDIIYRLLDDTDYDTFIVVDCTTNAKEHILNSKGPRVKYMVSSASIVDIFNLPLRDCFSSINEVPNCMFTLPMFSDYPLEGANRERFYLSSCGTYYDMLYERRR